MMIDNATNTSLLRTNLGGVLEVDLSGSQELTADGLLPLLKSEIIDLNVSLCPKLDDQAVAVIAQIPSLRALNLDLCDAITDGAVNFLTTARNLKSLSLRWCHDLSDRTCESVAIIGLTELSLEGIESITDSGARFLAKSTTLRTLVLPDHSDISDDGLRAISNGAMPLESLTVASLRFLSDDGIRSLGSLKSLRQLILVGMQQISEMSLSMLRADLPNIVITRMP